MTVDAAVLRSESAAAADVPGRPLGWWGMVSLIATEATIFAGLLSAYFFVRATSPDWPQGGIAPPELGRISAFTVVLLASSAPLVWAEAAVRRGRMRQVRIALIWSFVLGAAFLANQVLEYRSLGFGLRDNAYGSLFYAITGLHGSHVAVGLLMNLVVQAKARLGRLGPERHLTLSVFALYWHFVDVVWIFVFSSLYISPHLR
jgi:heme/copper-type cytochrome/quinol oxidase subunit 3